MDFGDEFDEPALQGSPPHAIIERYLAHYLHGTPEDLAGIPMVTYHDQVTDGWDTLDEWPPTSTALTFRLGAGPNLEGRSV